MRRTIIHLDDTDSTNSYLRLYQATQKESATQVESQQQMVVALAQYQTHGRGQGTNHWESERGKNLLFSVLTHPAGIPAERQFVLSMAGALALYDALRAYTEGISLKWPNDIYWHDSKISGTLIETTLKGRQIKSCIFGTGVNINQEAFYSDAPNPVSLRQITGHEMDKEEVLESILQHFEHYYLMATKGEYGTIATLYHQCLYRREGFWPFKDKAELFKATIIGIDHLGRLMLKDSEGKTRTYGFKEVSFCIGDNI